MRADPACGSRLWQSRRGVSTRHPELPFGWGSRAPLLNRLPGLIWLAYVGRGRPFDAEFDRDIQRFFDIFYHVTLAPPQVEELAGGGCVGSEPDAPCNDPRLVAIRYRFQRMAHCKCLK